MAGIEISVLAAEPAGVSSHQAVARTEEQPRAVDSVPRLVTDPATLWEFGVHGIPLVQYMKWADDVGLFVALADADMSSLDEVVARTPLTVRGADALLGVLCSLKLASRVEGGFALEAVAHEYLDRREPYYLGPSLYGALRAPLPPQLLKGQAVRRYSQFTGTVRDFLRYVRKKNQFGRIEQLLAQHRRNLPVNTIAARSPQFSSVRHLVDIGGGSGAFAIPLALEHPLLRITLVELPRALKHIPRFLEPHGVADRVHLLGLNVHTVPWPITGCDAILFGNVLHFCDDEECLTLLRESSRLLPSGGRVFVHEMLWNEHKNGPVATALWNFWLTTMSAGRQRTMAEIGELCSQAGLRRTCSEYTAGGFTLLTAAKT